MDKVQQMKRYIYKQPGIQMSVYTVSMENAIARFKELRIEVTSDMLIVSNERVDYVPHKQ